jgi:hypothetical protein
VRWTPFDGETQPEPSASHPDADREERDGRRGPPGTEDRDDRLGERRLAGDDIVPIPGTRNPEHLASNLAAARISLDRATLGRIEEVAPPDLAEGAALVA